MLSGAEVRLGQVALYGSRYILGRVSRADSAISGRPPAVGCVASDPYLDRISQHCARRW